MLGGSTINSNNAAAFAGVSDLTIAYNGKCGVRGVE
jgi:hypothetical protein